MRERLLGTLTTSVLLCAALVGCGGDDDALPVAAVRTDQPEVTYALPGEWVSADLSDERQVDKAEEELDERTDDASAWLTEAVEQGGTVLDLRLRVEPSTALLIAWPPGEEQGDATLAGLRARLGAAGADAAVVEHAVDYACVRVRSRTEDGGEELSYHLVHPDSGRMLTLRATAFGAPFDETDLESFDLVASHLWWDEPAASPPS